MTTSLQMVCKQRISVKMDLKFWFKKMDPLHFLEHIQEKMYALFILWKSDT